MTVGCMFTCRCRPIALLRDLRLSGTSPSSELSTVEFVHHSLANLRAKALFGTATSQKNIPGLKHVKNYVAIKQVALN